MTVTEVPFAEPIEPVTDANVEPLSLEPDENAPYGYMIDPDTKERRPKKRAGRPTKSQSQTGPILFGRTPTLDELRVTKPERKEDRSPDDPKPRPRGKRARTRRKPPPAPPLPPFKAGPIAKWVNGRYRKAGKIIRALDPAVGIAIIACTEKDDEDDVTVGEAWERVAEINPKIRRVLLKLMETGAWSALVAAHTPILLALLMKDSIQRFLPLGKLLGALFESDDPGGAFAAGAAEGGMTDQDVAAMMQMAQQMAAQMAMQMGATMPRSSGAAGAAGPRPPASTPYVIDAPTEPE